MNCISLEFPLDHSKCELLQFFVSNTHLPTVLIVLISEYHFPNLYKFTFPYLIEFPNLIPDGIVTGISITNPGSGYIIVPPPLKL